MKVTGSNRGPATSLQELSIPSDAAIMLVFPDNPAPAVVIPVYAGRDLKLDTSRSIIW